MSAIVREMGEPPSLIPHIPADYDWDDVLELVVETDDGRIVQVVEFLAGEPEPAPEPDA